MCIVLFEMNEVDFSGHDLYVHDNCVNINLTESNKMILNCKEH